MVEPFTPRGRHALDVELLRVIHASQLSTSLKRATKVSLADPPLQAHRALAQRRFDQAPVHDNGTVVGWVAASRLPSARSVESAMVPLAKATLLSTDAPMDQLLPALRKHSLVFIVGNAGLSGFVARSDLERHAARSHFVLLISGIEMLLSDIVMTAMDEEAIVKALRPIQNVRWKRAVSDGQEANPVEYLYIEELARLFRRTHYASKEAGWDARLNSTLGRLCSFRNSVFHANQPILTDKRSAAVIADLVRDAVALAEFLADCATRAAP